MLDFEECDSARIHRDPAYDGRFFTVVRCPSRRAAIRLSAKSAPSPAPPMAARQLGLANHRFGPVNQPESAPPRAELHYVAASQPLSDC